jgi:hypothetical protein
MKPTLLLLLAATGGLGCDFQFNLAVSSTAAVLQRGAKSMNAESDVALAREAIPGTIKTVDSFLTAKPDNPIFLELTAQAYIQYAFGFLEDDMEKLPEGDSPQRAVLVDRATNLYDRGSKLGYDLIALDDKDFAAEFKNSATRDKALKEAKSAAGLYWAGFGLGSAINLHRDNVDRIADLPMAIALLEKSHTLDPTYFNHGAALTLAVVYSSQGKAMGGNPEKAKALFDEVIKGTNGKFLMAKVMLARFYATVTLDRPLFEATLKEVLATPADCMPEERLANELAHIRAKRYLAHADDYF